MEQDEDKTKNTKKQKKNMIWLMWPRSTYNQRNYIFYSENKQKSLKIYNEWHYFFYLKLQPNKPFTMKET